MSNGVPRCDESLCSELSKQISETCKALGWPPDHPVLVLDPGTREVCLCTCSGARDMGGPGSKKTDELPEAKPGGQGEPRS